MSHLKPKVEFTDTGKLILICSDNTKHILTLTEQLMFRIGVLDIELLDKQYNSNDQKG